MMTRPVLSDSTILVTGASGFLGRHVLQSLKQSHPDVRVVALVRSVDEWHRLDWTSAFSNVELLEGGVTGDCKWMSDGRLADLTGILHLAAVVHHSRHGSEAMFETNVAGTLRMVELASQYKCRMVYVSTSGTVGCFKSAEQFAYEDAPYADTTVGKWPYYRSKIESEKQAFERAQQLGVQLTVVRPPVMLGPGDHKFRSTGYVLKHLHRKFPFLVSGGMHFIDVRDASQAIVTALWHPTARPIYHLSGTSTSVETFFKMCEEVSGVPMPSHVVKPKAALLISKSADKIATTFRKKSPLPDPVVVEMAGHYWNVRSRYAEHELQYHSRSPYQTLADTVSWIKQNHPSFVSNI